MTDILQIQNDAQNDVQIDVQNDVQNYIQNDVQMISKMISKMMFKSCFRKQGGLVGRRPSNLGDGGRSPAGKHGGWGGAGPPMTDILQIQNDAQNHVQIDFQNDVISKMMSK